MSGMEWCARGFLTRGPPALPEEAEDGDSAGGGTRGQTKLAGARKEGDMDWMRGFLIRGAAEGANEGAEMVQMGCAHAQQKCTHSLTAVSSFDEILSGKETPPCLEMVEEGSVLTHKPPEEKEEVHEVHDRALGAQKAECDFELPPARLDPQTIVSPGSSEVDTSFLPRCDVEGDKEDSSRTVLPFDFEDDTQHERSFARGFVVQSERHSALIDTSGFPHVMERDEYGVQAFDRLASPPPPFVCGDSIHDCKESDGRLSTSTLSPRQAFEVDQDAQEEEGSEDGCNGDASNYEENDGKDHGDDMDMCTHQMQRACVGDDDDDDDDTEADKIDPVQVFAHRLNVLNLLREQKKLNGCESVVVKTMDGVRDVNAMIEEVQEDLITLMVRFRDRAFVAIEQWGIKSKAGIFEKSLNLLWEAHISLHFARRSPASKFRGLMPVAELNQRHRPISVQAFKMLKVEVTIRARELVLHESDFDSMMQVDSLPGPVLEVHDLFVTFSRAANAVVRCEKQSGVDEPDELQELSELMVQAFCALLAGVGEEISNDVAELVHHMHSMAVFRAMETILEKVTEESTTAVRVVKTRLKITAQVAELLMDPSIGSYAIPAASLGLSPELSKVYYMASRKLISKAVDGLRLECHSSGALASCSTRRRAPVPGGPLLLAAAEQLDTARKLTEQGLAWFRRVQASPGWQALATYLKAKESEGFDEHLTTIYEEILKEMARVDKFLDHPKNKMFQKMAKMRGGQQMAKTCIARRAAQTQVIDQQTEPDRAAEIERMQQLLIKQEADEQQQTLRKQSIPLRKKKIKAAIQAAEHKILLDVCEVWRERTNQARFANRIIAQRSRIGIVKHFNQWREKARPQTSVTTLVVDRFVGTQGTQAMRASNDASGQSLHTNNLVPLPVQLFPSSPQSKASKGPGVPAIDSVPLKDLESWLQKKQTDGVDCSAELTAVLRQAASEEMGPEDLGSALHRLFVLAAKCPELRPAICGSVALQVATNKVQFPSPPVDLTAKLCGLLYVLASSKESALIMISHGFDEALFRTLEAHGSSWNVVALALRALLLVLRRMTPNELLRHKMHDRVTLIQSIRCCAHDNSAYANLALADQILGVLT